MQICDWNIDVEALPGPSRADIHYVNDVGFPSPDGQRLAVIYSVDEIRMGWDVGLLAVFRDSDRPKLLLNSASFLCCCPSDAVIWLSADLFAVKKHYYNQEDNKLNVPFALIDLAGAAYSFIAMPNSCSYTLTLNGKTVRIAQRTKDELFAGYDGQEVPLTQIPWFPLSALDAFDNNYAESAA